jgi:hypothetical protein
VDHTPDKHSTLKQSEAGEVEKKDEAGQQHMDACPAISDAFEAARGQLEKYAASQREVGRDRENLSAAGRTQS